MYAWHLFALWRVQYEARLPLPPDEAPLGALLVSRAVASVQRAAAAAPAAAPPPPPQPPPTGRSGSGGLGEVGTALLGGLSHAVRGSIGGAAPPAAPAPPAAAAGIAESRREHCSPHAPRFAGSTLAGGGFSELAISLHWYISLERRDPRHGPHYAAVYDALHVGLAATPAGAALRSMLRRQEALVGALSAAAQARPRVSRGGGGAGAASGAPPRLATGAQGGGRVAAEADRAAASHVREGRRPARAAPLARRAAHPAPRPDRGGGRRSARALHRLQVPALSPAPSRRPSPTRP